MAAARNQRDTRGGSRTVKINYNTVCDMERAEKFKGFLNQLMSAKKLNKLRVTPIMRKLMLTLYTETMRFSPSSTR